MIVVPQAAVGPAVDVACDALVVGVIGAGGEEQHRMLATDDASCGVLRGVLHAAPDLGLNGTPGLIRIVPAPAGVRARVVVLVDLGTAVDEDVEATGVATVADAVRSVRHLRRIALAFS